MASPEKLYGSMYVEQTTIQKSQQVSLYNLHNILNFSPQKFRQTVDQKTPFLLRYSVPYWDQLMRIDTAALHRTNELRNDGHTINAYMKWVIDYFKSLVEKGKYHLGN